ncbi:MAG: protein kinase [Myxococcales bacterium]|nr:protein kinase [Myxococcales bacterium]
MSDDTTRIELPELESEDTLRSLPRRDPCPRCRFARARGRCMRCEPPESVGSYRVEEVVGSGGMSVVYRAVDPWLGRNVALKMLRPDLKPQWAMMLVKEARALASVKSPHVVQVYTFGSHEDAFFFAMEYVDGWSLDVIIREHKEQGQRVPMHRALAIIDQVAMGLDAVHAREIVHRDVKPSNIVIERDTGRPVLVDFGLAIADGVRRNTAGSPHYMAPEQWRGETLDARCDVYGLACCAYELLTGTVAFPGGTLRTVGGRHCAATRPLPSRAMPRLAPLDPVFAKALARAPAERFATCYDFATRLARVAEGHKLFRTPALRSDRPSEEVSEEALRVLVVEDDPAFAKLARRAVQLAFFGKDIRVKVVRSGDEAFDTARRKMPSLVLIDWETRDEETRDGLETLSRLRSLPGGAGIRAIIVAENEPSIARFAVLGVQDIVPKHCGIEVLVDTILAVARRAGWYELLPAGDD